MAARQDARVAEPNLSREQKKNGHLRDNGQMPRRHRLLSSAAVPLLLCSSAVACLPFAVWSTCAYVQELPMSSHIPTAAAGLACPCAYRSQVVFLTSTKTRNRTSSCVHRVGMLTPAASSVAPLSRCGETRGGKRRRGGAVQKQTEHAEATMHAAPGRSLQGMARVPRWRRHPPTRRRVPLLCLCLPPPDGISAPSPHHPSPIPQSHGPTSPHLW